MADKPAQQNITLIPWDPESQEHVDRLYIQRVACGWKADKIEKWRICQREGSMSLHWVVRFYHHVIMYCMSSLFIQLSSSNFDL